MTDIKLLLLHSYTWNHLTVWKNELLHVLNVIYKLYIYKS